MGKKSAKITYIVTTLQETQNIAEQIAAQLHGGAVIGLVGNLGAGKTTFTQYLAAALGVRETVNSPTFNIIKIYKIRKLKTENRKLIHIDAYRLHAARELEALGVDEYFTDPRTVTVVEWADRVKKILPKNAIIIKITLKKDGERIFEIK